MKPQKQKHKWGVKTYFEFDETDWYGEDPIGVVV